MVCVRDRVPSIMPIKFDLARVKLLHHVASVTIGV